MSCRVLNPIALLGVAAFVGIMCWQQMPAKLALAAAPKDSKDKEIDQLKKQVKDKEQELERLRRDIKDRDATLTRLQTDLRKLPADKDRELTLLRQTADQTQRTMADKDKLIAQLQADASKTPGDMSTELQQLRKTTRDLESLKKAPYVHTVILRLKSDAPTDEVDALLAEAPKLLDKVDTVRGYWVGKPADQSTPDLAVKDYQVGILVLFDDYDGLQKCLDNAAHKEFMDKHSKYWDKVPVYDFIRQK